MEESDSEEYKAYSNSEGSKTYFVPTRKKEENEETAERQKIDQVAIDIQNDDDIVSHPHDDSKENELAKRTNNSEEYQVFSNLEGSKTYYVPRKNESSVGIEEKKQESCNIIEDNENDRNSVEKEMNDVMTESNKSVDDNGNHRNSSKLDDKEQDDSETSNTSKFL